MEITPEQKETWNNYDYGHKQVIRELNIDAAKLPNDIKARIRGFNLGLSKINSDEGYNKLVTQSAAIGDAIITWSERDANEEETTSTESSNATSTESNNGSSSTESSNATSTESNNGSSSTESSNATSTESKETVVASGESGKGKPKELTEQEVLDQHSGSKKKVDNSNNDGNGFFGWDDDE